MREEAERNEENKRRNEEEKKRIEGEKKKFEEEIVRVREAEERRKKEEEETRRKEREEVQKRIEEEKRRIEAEKKNFEAEKKKAKEAEEKRSKEEEARRQKAEEVKRRNDEEKERNEEQKRKNEEQKRRTEEEAKANEERKRELEEEASANEIRMEQEAKANEERERKLADEAKANEEEAKVNEERRIENEEEARENEKRKIRLEEEAREIQKGIQAAEEKSRVDEEARELAEKESARYKLDLEEGIQPIKWPTQEEVDSIKERLQYREDYFHFAITGAAGSGKSSLINAFRGFKNKQEGAAPVGVTETTQEIGRYPDPDNTPPRAWTVWFDVPGAGTPKIPEWQYFNQQGLFIFDLIIVAVDARLTKIDVSILENCRRFKIPSFIVRSKANQHIQNVMKDMGYDSEDSDGEDPCELRTRARAEYIEDTRRGFESVLREANLPVQKTYIVANTTVYALIKSQKIPKDIIDEVDLIKDLLLAAHRRRYPSQESQS